LIQASLATESAMFSTWTASILVNTACSSSMYAMHNACNALRNKECSAVVGGTNLVLTVDQHMNTAKLGVLSPLQPAILSTWPPTVMAELMALAPSISSDSRRCQDGDPIRGVIRSSAVNS
jgi:acetyl-CoA acetyltransferase